MKGLYFYKLMSPYPEDVAKNCKLSINEIDSNFLNLKDEDIKSAEFDCETNTLILTRNNGEKVQVDMSCVYEGLSSNLYETLTADLENEVNERESADDILSGAIETERQERIAFDRRISDAIEERTNDFRAEVKDRTDTDEILSGAITDIRDALDNESNRAAKSESGLSDAIKAEETRAKNEENRIEGLIHKGGTYVVSVNHGVLIPSYDGIEEHNITLNFDGDFGEI